MKRDTVTAYRRRTAATERLVDDAVAAVKADRDTKFDAAGAAHRAAEAERVRFTRDDLQDARAVRTLDGWRRVVRVNASTVTVQTPYSWTDRVRFDRILEVLK